MPKKFTYQQVKNYVNEIGESILLSCDYENSATPLSFQCKCGNKFNRTFAKFLYCKQYICPTCARKNQAEKQKAPLQEIKEFISKSGCEYVSGEYKNNNSPLTIKCFCGNTFVKDFSHFKRGQNRCPQCGNKALKKARTKYSLEKAKDMLQKRGYALLENEYIDCQTPMRCTCEKGHEFTIKLAYFMNGHSGCKLCANESLKGENHYNYKGGESEVIDYFRKHLKEWKMTVAKKYNYVCALTGSKKDCVVHHIISFNTILKEACEETNLSLRQKIKDYTKEEFERLEKAVMDKHTIDNGVLLQRKVHNRFHAIYGKGNNTKEQFLEFATNN